MERGERLLVLSVVTVVGVMALTSMFVTPTGNVPQGGSFYMTQTGSSCEAGLLILKDDPTSRTYCCQEHMIGQNTCKFPFTIVKAR